MAKIINKNSFNGQIAKIVETPDEMIFNGHYYNKGNFNPMPLQFLPILNADFLLHKQVFIDGGYPFNKYTQGYITDKDNSNISWINAPYNYIRYGYRLIKITNGVNGFESAEYDLSYSGNERLANMDIISQDSERIYFLEASTYSSLYNSIFSFNKNSLTKTNIANLGLGKFSVIFENSSFIYLAANVYVSATRNCLRIQKYNKFNGALTIIFEEIEDNVKMVYGLTTKMASDGTFYIVKNNKLTSGKDEMYVRKINLNTNDDTITTAKMKFDLTNYKDNFISIIEDVAEIQTDIFEVNEGDDKYLNIIRFNCGASTVNLAPERSSLYTFKVVSDTLVFIDEVNSSPVVTNGYLLLNNNKLLITGSKSGIVFYNWNSMQLKFEKTNSYDYPIKSFGADINNNIWILLNDGSVELLSITLPIKIAADFEQNEYEFNGSDIITSAQVYCTNFINQYISAKLELTLTGPAEFINASPLTPKKYSVTTSSTNIMNVDVKITGAGLVRINTQYVN